MVVTARAKWGNPHKNLAKRLFGIIVGGGSLNASKEMLQETILVTGMRLENQVYDMSYVPRVAGPHRLHFFFLEPGADLRMLAGLGNDVQQAFQTVADIDWGLQHTKQAPRQANIFPGEGYFSSQFYGRIQFPSAGDFVLRI